MSRGRAKGLLGQQTVASRRQAREQRAELTFRKVGVIILTLIGMGILVNVWLAWEVTGDLRSLAVSRDEHRQGKEFNRELVAQRDELLSSKSIEKKAAVLGLFKPGKKQTRKP
jgi:cell division septal protein FtsQ